MTIITAMDNLDDRRETWGLLCALTPPLRVDFLDWVLSFARRQRPTVGVLTGAKADRTKMLPMVRAAIQRDVVADILLANEIYADIVGLCHQWQLDFRAIVTELEQWTRRPADVSSGGRDFARIRTVCSTASARLVP